VIKVLFAAGAILLVASMAQAQTESAVSPQPITEALPHQIPTALVAPGDLASYRVLPDAPKPPALVKPVKPGVLPTPCPFGVGKPCALLGGRLYFSDPSHMTEHDRTWSQAMSHPLMRFSVAVGIGAFVWDYKTTRYCIDRHLGREGNPIEGQTRAQELAVGLGITAFSFWAAGKLKEKGEGNKAFAEEWLISSLHFLAAAHNRAACSGR
jgi:hypothetical protein